MQKNTATHAVHFPSLEKLRMLLATLWLDRSVTVN
jgi:hypothetical protein